MFAQGSLNLCLWGLKAPSQLSNGQNEGKTDFLTHKRLRQQNSFYPGHWYTNIIFKKITKYFAK